MFELNEGKHHDHLVCLDCGRVEEFFDAEIEKRQRAIAQTRGFELQDHALALYAACTKKNCPHRQGQVTPAPRLTRGPARQLAALLHRLVVALDELLVGVDAAQLQDGVAHRGLDQHGEVAAGIDRDHGLAHRRRSRMSSYSGS